ncbi:putative Mg2+ transporter-C (MgtC) family protein [Actinocorallia herbida]|uniref:Putative Mg2+ transporter-C (MgtC) family protein n=1 Tax=Actinocorallia herbida TaxID=58109 RepID=A0A3N1CWE6_9ACTN|nr:MgtC/SapB family protein [Actinocorallia herbida]ROO85619.1 putative Mg2+ transporter-C (MgtC) family protein [Actinocorallia herbida]
MVLSPGQGWAQLGELGLALLLSASIGLERGLRNKSAGLRTHTLVGVGSALFMLVSIYGFSAVSDENASLDPSRVASQIVSGIGFIGGGLIFVRRDAVRGLTTAAVVWVTAAVGMACGAGLPVLAVAVTVGHFVIVLGLDRLTRRLSLGTRPAHRVTFTYAPGNGVLRDVLVSCSDLGYSVTQTDVDRSPDPHARVTVALLVQGRRPLTDLVTTLTDLPGILSLTTADEDD